MLVSILNARWRKFTDVNRDHALFELSLDETILVDVGLSDDNEWEISFHAGIAGVVTDLDSFMKVIHDGKALAEGDL